jgi:beta-lactamase superfamily II metal-dependent hydrolase
MGNAGVAALASGLKQNKSLSRLGLASVGVSDDGTIALCQALQNHAKLTMLDVGQAYATEDLNAR